MDHGHDTDGLGALGNGSAVPASMLAVVPLEIFRPNRLFSILARPAQPNIWQPCRQVTSATTPGPNGEPGGMSGRLGRGGMAAAGRGSCRDQDTEIEELSVIGRPGRAWPHKLIQLKASTSEYDFDAGASLHMQDVSLHNTVFCRH
jgi:hypothetical protein